MTAVAATVDAVARPSSRRLALLPLVAFAAAAAGAGLARAVTTTYLPLLLNEIDDAPGLIGTVMLVNAIAGFVVPLVVGVWSDRVEGPRRRSAFIVGGSILGAGGLVATAAGASSSYLVLTAAGAVVYVGLNAVTTVHRALVPERFGAAERPRATSAQELALLGGGLAGIAVGGALTEVALWAPFLVAALLLPLLALPTLSSARGAGRRVEREQRARPDPRLLPRRGAAPRRRRLPHGAGAVGARLRSAPGVLPPLRRGRARAAPGRGIALARRVRDRHGSRDRRGRPGAARVAPAAAAPRRRGADGRGLPRRLRVDRAARRRPGAPGRRGRVRADLDARLPPLLGAHPGRRGGRLQRALLLRPRDRLHHRPPRRGLARRRHRQLPGAVRARRRGDPLPRSCRSASPSGRRARGRIAAGLLALVPALGLLVAHTPVRELDEALFLAINGLFDAPELLWRVLDPHTRNYVILVAAALIAAIVTGPRRLPRVATLVLGAAVVAWGLLEAVYSVYDRARPEEVLEAGEIVLEGHTWAHLNSFPSGHMAITAALASGAAIAFPRFRFVLALYVGAVAFTRVLFGAHFPLDTVAGTALGIASALLVAMALDRASTRAKGSDPGVADAARRRRRRRRDPLVRRRALAGAARRRAGAGRRDRPRRRRLLARPSPGSSTPPRHPSARRSSGSRNARARARPSGGDRCGARGAPRLEAVMVVDADGQHPPEAIAEFVAAAASADLVVGDRFADLASMPFERRLANRTTRRLFALVSGHPVRDTQNGMRLLRREALELFPGGGYEAETTHLRRVLRAGLSVAWVPMPAIYGAERSSFRAGRDSAAVLWALVRPLERPFPRLRRSPLRAGFRPARPSGSALPGTRATPPPRPRARAAVA